MNQLTFLIPLKVLGGHYEHNAERYKILRQSLDRFYKGEVAKSVKILCPDAELNYVKELCGKEVRVVPDSEIVPNIHVIRGTNWMKQQFLKLSASLYSDTPFTMTLDPDNFATRPFGVEDLIRAERALIDFCPFNSHPHWWTACAKLVGIENCDIPQQIMHVTPCIYAREATRQLKLDLENRYEGDWSQILLNNNDEPDTYPAWIENGIYYLNLVRKNQVEKFHFTANEFEVEPIHNSNELWIKENLHTWDASACFDGRSTGIFSVAQGNTYIPPSVILSKIIDYI